MQLETKVRLLAASDATLQSHFGTSPFRWFDRRLLPGYIQAGTCARVLRVSTVSDYSQFGLMNLNQPRLQIDVLSFDSDEARSAVSAVMAWMDSVSFAESGSFGSPPTNPLNSPNFLLNRRSSMEAQVEQPSASTSASPGPVYVETLDYRLFNLEA